MVFGGVLGFYVIVFRSSRNLKINKHLFCMIFISLFILIEGSVLCKQESYFEENKLEFIVWKEALLKPKNIQTIEKLYHP